MAQHSESARSVGECVRQWRVDAGRSQRDLASKVGVSFPHISKIENGSETASTELLQRIAKELGRDESELMRLAQRVPDDLAGFVAENELAMTLLRRLKSGEITDQRVRELLDETNQA